MIYLTQLIFLKKNKEDVFHQFEEMIIPIMEKHNGYIVYRIRPAEEAFIAGDSNTPYELHFIYFRTEQGLDNFLSDEERIEFLRLKEESVQSQFIVKGEKMEI